MEKLTEKVTLNHAPRFHPRQRLIHSLVTTAGQAFLSEDLASFLFPDLVDAISKKEKRTTIPPRSFHFLLIVRNSMNLT